MFFKTAVARSYAKAFIATLVFISISGCGQMFGEKPPSNIRDTKIGFETQCLETALPVMKGFMNGTATESEVRATWQCFSSGIRAFQRKVIGSNQSHYQARELAKFFEDYFFVGLKINDRLLEQIMHVKQIFIGGSGDVITRAELTELIDFAQFMENLSIDLLPYMKVYSMNWSFDVATRFGENVEFFEEANVVIQKSAKALAARIEKNKQSYSIRNFLTLMMEAEKLYGEDWSWLSTFERMMPFIEKLVQTLSGGQNGIIAADEWRRFSILGVRGYVQYLRYYYFMKDSESIGTSQIVYLTNSVDDLFSFLGDMVKEKPSGVFTKAELIDIATAIHDLFPKVRISEELINQAMKVKVLFFGGSADVWTNLDFINGQGKVKLFRSFAEKFLNFADVYLLRWHPDDLSDEEASMFFQQAIKNLNEVGGLLSQIMESDYDLQDLLKICDELDRLATPEDRETELSWIEYTRKNLPIFIHLKQIILNDQSTVIQKKTWPRLLQTVVDFYSQVMDYKYFLNDKNLMFGSGLSRLDQFAQEVSRVLGNFIHNRGENGKVIKFAEMDRLLYAFSKSSYWHDGLDVESTRPLLRILFNRILLDPEKRLSSQNKNDGMSIDSVKYLTNEYSLWSSNQHAIEKIFVDEVREFSGEAIIEYLKPSVSNEGIRELTLSFKTPVSLSLKANGLIEIAKQNSTYNIRSASMHNFSRIISRTLLRSYAGDLKRIKSLAGVSTEEVQLLYKEIQPFLEQMDIIDPKNDGFAKNRFFEANLFTPSGDGSELMSYQEGSHFVLMLLSGVKLNSGIEPILRSECEIKESKTGRKSQDLIYAQCAAEKYYAYKDKFFESMPQMRDYIHSMQPNQFLWIYRQLLKSAGWKENPQGLVRMTEVNLIPHIFQYQELLMQRFDIDNSDVITDKEANLAYPVFGPMINSLSPTKIKAINRAAFYYLLKYGSLPQKLSDAKKFMKVMLQHELLNKPMGIAADRAKLTQVFGAIADLVQKSDDKVAPDFLEED